jgi:hypothetical protein
VSVLAPLAASRAKQGLLDSCLPACCVGVCVG